MERKKHTSLKLAVAGMVAASGLSNCTTTYDAYGRPVQSVDPGAAAIGAVALGVAAYAIGKNNGSSHKHYHGHHGGYYKHHGYHGYKRARCY